MDRNQSCNLPTMQIDFIDAMALPLYQVINVNFIIYKEFGKIMSRIRKFIL